MNAEGSSKLLRIKAQMSVKLFIRFDFMKKKGVDNHPESSHKSNSFFLNFIIFAKR